MADDSAVTIQSDVRVGYQAAIQLIVYEGQLQWRMTAVFVPFSGLLIAAAILPSFIGLTDRKIVALVATAFSVVGMVVSFMWWSMLARSRKYYKYWIASARELEKLLSSHVQTLSRGQNLPDKQTVDGQVLVFEGRERIRVASNLNVLYVTFLATFGLLLIWNVTRIVQAF